MKKIIQAMEELGKSGSINQYNSVEEMLCAHNINAKCIESGRLISRDLICSMEPDDDED